MPEIMLTPRLVPTLLAGIVLALAGCAKDPDPQPKQKVQTEDNSAAPTAMPAKSATSDNTLAPPPAEPRLNVDGEGLRWFFQPSGNARAVPFGLAQGEVLASVEAARGPAIEGTNQDCGAGPVQYARWPDGLSLTFQKGRFVGWSLDSRANSSIATSAGIAPGATRGDLDSAYKITVDQTSLGTEFSTGDMYGVLEGRGTKAMITDMWAGVNCVAR